MAQPVLDTLPGYRRRFRVTPTMNQVVTELEDDYHCMRIVIGHDGKVAQHIEAIIHRAPWTTCPGAQDMLTQTFTGVPLTVFAERGEKRSNCTHLHDMAVLGAAHAAYQVPLQYDILVSDPVAGVRHAELRRNGVMLLRWSETNGQLAEPAELAGLTLMNMSSWIAGLEPARQEAARLLRWGFMVANGRTIPMERQSDAKSMPDGGCYTFQPHRKTTAIRVGEIRDFSNGVAPLDTQH